MRQYSLVVPFAALCLGTVAAGTAAADESTSINGTAFIDLTHVEAKNNGTATAATGTGFDVKRFYFDVNHKFDDIWSVRFTTDFNYIAADSETQIYIKYAYLQAKLSNLFVAKLGDAGLPWVPFVEDIYGYRYVENVLIDRLKYGTSADYGLNISGSAPIANYSVSVVDGNGYKNPTRSKTVDVEARIGITPLPGLTVAIGGYEGKLGADVQGTTTYHDASRFDALVAYVQGGLRLGGEYFSATNGTKARVLAQNGDKADGFSFWGSYDFTKTYGFFARYDHAKTSKTLNPDLEDQYFNVGFVTHPRKGVDLSLVYKHEETSGTGSISESNGTITGGANGDGKYDEFGVWAQVKF